MAPQPSTYT
ncbi:hypothetical protein CP8484711_2993, partial [Chlamydia psittaci 84-8471/1]